MSGIDICEEPRTLNKTGSKFRQIARDTSGETFNIPDGNNAAFAYVKTQSFFQGTAVGCIAYRHADGSETEPGTRFASPYFHEISFLFVKRDFQSQGLGSRLMCHAVSKLIRKTARPIRVSSAMKAVPFFEKLGFERQGAPVDVVCGGSDLFRTLINMELSVEKARHFWKHNQT